MLGIITNTNNVLIIVKFKMAARMAAMKAAIMPAILLKGYNSLTIAARKVKQVSKSRFLGTRNSIKCSKLT